MDTLPVELLDLILPNLFAKDRLAFSLVCRAWDKALAASAYRHSPCLMLNNRDTTIWKVFQHNNFFSMDFPDLDKKAVIRCSNHGWLLMCTDDEILFFFDPFNNQRIEVPRLPKKNRYTTMSFFHPPTSPDCFIVGIDGVHNCIVEIGLLKHGEDEWNISSVELKKLFGASLAPPILDGGKLCFLDFRGNIATFDMSRDPIAKSGYVYNRCLKQRRLRRNIKEHYLIKIKGEDAIFGVFVMNDDHGGVRVFRLLDNILWEPVEDLGDKVFYVSNSSSFGYITRNKNIANKIFFSKFNRNKVVFYSLETRKYHSFEGDYSSENMYGLQRYEHAAWMMPATLQFPGEPLTWCVQDDATHQDTTI